MKITEVPMATFEQHAWCDCGGEITCTGDGFSNNLGTTWNHKCSKCGRTEGVQGKSYPRIVRKEEGLNNDG